MHIGNCFHCVKSIELIIPPTETFREGVVRGVVLVLQLKLLRPTASIVHVVSPIVRRAYVNPCLWVFVTVTVLDMELCFLEVLCVLGVRVDALLLQLLLDDLALDESLRFLKVIHGTDNLRVSGYDVGSDVCVFSPNPVLDPDRSILVVGGLVEVVLSAGRKHTAFCIIHLLIIIIIIKRRMTFLILFGIRPFSILN